MLLNQSYGLIVHSVQSDKSRRIGVIHSNIALFVAALYYLRLIDYPLIAQGYIVMRWSLRYFCFSGNSGGICTAIL